MRILILISVVLSLSGWSLAAQTGNLFSSAIYEEEVTGNLDRALELYNQLLKTKNIDAADAARALYHIGLIHEKLGDGKAADYYNKLIKQFPEQLEWIELARKRLKTKEKNGTFTDVRDGRKYPVVQIGGLTWMSENLAFMDHVNPARKQENGIWVYGYNGSDTTAAKTAYNFNTFGCLYDWTTAMGLDSSAMDSAMPGKSDWQRGICPPGWHLPDLSEWSFIQGDLSKFNHQAGGFRQDITGEYFGGIGTGSYYWAASGSVEHNGRIEAPSIRITSLSGLENIPEPVSHGFSIRCVKNAENGPTSGVAAPIDWNKHSQLPDKDRGRIIPSAPVDSGLTLQPAVIWQFHNRSFYGRFSLIGNRVYIAPQVAQLFVLDHASGRELWTCRDTFAFTGYFNPIPYQNGILVQRYYPDQVWTLLGIDTLAHKVTWKYRLGTFLNQAVVQQNYLLGYDKDSCIIAVNLNSSKTVWSYRPPTGLTTKLVVSGDLVLAGFENPETLSSDEFRKNWTLAAFDLETGFRQWNFDAGLRFNGTPEISGDRGYIGSDDGYLYCIDLITGKKLWRFYTHGEIRDSPLVVNGIVVFGSTEGFIYALDSGNGQFLWKSHYSNTGKSWKPASDGRRLYITEREKWLFCLDLQTGLEIWKYEFPGEFTSGPVVQDGMILIAAGFTLYALK